MSVFDPVHRIVQVDFRETCPECLGSGVTVSPIWARALAKHGGSLVLTPKSVVPPYLFPDVSLPAATALDRATVAPVYADCVRCEGSGTVAGETLHIRRSTFAAIRQRLLHDNSQAGLDDVLTAARVDDSQLRDEAKDAEYRGRAGNSAVGSTRTD